MRQNWKWKTSRWSVQDRKMQDQKIIAALRQQTKGALMYSVQLYVSKRLKKCENSLLFKVLPYL